MAASIGNLAIVISGNARPFQQTLRGVQNQINQFSTTNNFFEKSLSGGGGGQAARYQYGSLGRLASSSFVKAFGGGFTGALVGVAIGQTLEMVKDIGSAIVHAFAEIGHQAAMFLADSFQEGLKVARMEQGVNFLAGGPGLGAEWMKSLRSLSASSGFEMVSLGQSMRTLAGSTDDLSSVVPTLRAIAEISAGIGAEAEQMNRFALAVAQVTAAGRFEAQELNQLTEAGMPIKELAKTANMTVGQFRAAVKDGAVSVSVLAETFNRMVGPGGKFFNMLVERSKTAVGQIDQLSARWMLFKQELGRGIIEGMQRNGFLGAGQTALDSMFSRAGELPGFIDKAAQGLKSLTIGGARFAGIVYDTFTYWRIITEETLNTLRVMARMYELLTKINPALDAFNPLTGLEGLFMLSPIPDPRKIFKDWGTGSVWAKEVADAFNKEFKSNIDPYLPIRIDPALPAKLQKLVDDTKQSMSEGITPFQKFRSAMDQIDAIRKFDMLRASTGGFFERAFGAANPNLSPGVENQLLANSFLELEKSLHLVAQKFPEAMARGSQEAASAITNAAFQGQDRSVAQRVVDAIRETKRRDDQAAEDIASIAAAVRRLDVIPFSR